MLSLKHPKQALTHEEAKEIQGSITASNMTPSLIIISDRSTLAVGQKAIAAQQKEFKSVTVTQRAFQSWRSVWRVRTLFEAFGGILVVSYLFAIAALGAALLFYTFNR